MKRISKYFFATVIIAIFTAISLSPIYSTHAYSSICDYPDSQVSPEVKAANGCGGAVADIKDVAINVINGVVAVLGLVAVVFIIVGGINYMTSAGDSGKVEKAKKTILYSVIGLVICVLAFAIVNFVVANVIK